jgi:hypothetical protein
MAQPLPPERRAVGRQSLSRQSTLPTDGRSTCVTASTDAAAPQRKSSFGPLHFCAARSVGRQSTSVPHSFLGSEDSPQGSRVVSATAQRCPRRRFVLTEVTSLQKDLRSKQSEAATAAEDCARLKDALRDLYAKWSVADAVARSSSATLARHVERLQVRCQCMPPGVVAGP